MATPKIPLVSGQYYHIYNRGNNKTDIFIKNENYYYFLKLWKKHITPVADTYAYCLLSNHFHALIKVKDNFGGLPQSTKSNKTPAEQCFSNLFNAYSKAINKRYERTGRLFQEKYKRKCVTDDGYLLRLVVYIHANPQRHGFVHDFRDYAHSSYYSFLSNGQTALQKNDVLNWFGGQAAFEAFHAEQHQALIGLDDFLDD